MLLAIAFFLLSFAAGPLSFSSSSCVLCVVLCRLFLHWRAPRRHAHPLARPPRPISSSILLFFSFLLLLFLLAPAPSAVLHSSSLQLGCFCSLLGFGALRGGRLLRGSAQARLHSPPRRPFLHGQRRLLLVCCSDNGGGVEEVSLLVVELWGRVLVK